MKEKKLLDDFALLAGLLGVVNTDALRAYSLLQISASATWLVVATVIRTIGIDWRTFHAWLVQDTVLYDRLITRYLHRHEGNQNLLTGSVSFVLRELINLVWPKMCLPQFVKGWDVDVADNILLAIGGGDAGNFAATKQPASL